MESKVTGNAVIKKLDSFWCSPNHMNTVRQVYVDILVEIAQSDLLIDIMQEITGDHVTLEFTDPNLYLEIKNSEYCLS